MSSTNRMISAAALIAALSNTMACATGASGVVVTTASPAEIAVTPADRSGSGGGGRDYIEIAVQGFRPSAAGPVEFVVDLPGEGEVGRFGLFPERPFSASDPSRTQRFSFPITAAARAGAVRTVRVRLIVSRGDGGDAFADITARLSRHD